MMGRMIGRPMLAGTISFRVVVAGMAMSTSTASSPVRCGMVKLWTLAGRPWSMAARSSAWTWMATSGSFVVTTKALAARAGQEETRGESGKMRPVGMR